MNETTQVVAGSPVTLSFPHYDRPRIPRLPWVSRKNAEPWALTIACLVFTGAVIWIGPHIQSQRPTVQLVQVILSAVSIEVMFLLLRWYFAICWAYPLLGRWAYIAVPTSGTNPGPLLATASLVRFSVGWDQRLKYEVRLFASPEDALAASENVATSPPSVGKAVDHGITFDSEQNHLWILYEVLPHNGDPRRSGHLFLNLVDETRADGHWSSDDGRSFIARGSLHMTRPDKFKTMVKEVRHVQPQMARGGEETMAGAQ